MGILFLEIIFNAMQYSRRDFMLDQIIYTRCSKHRSLENNGQEEIQDGFNVYSMSEEIFSHYTKDELNFLKKRIMQPNASSEREPIGLLTSYEYFKIIGGNKVISRLDGRPICKDTRKNGSANRGGTIINQTFLGDFEGYAFEFINSPDWNATQKSEIEYYHDDADEKVPYLPVLDREMYPGDISVEYIRTFLSPRKDVYKKVLFFLMQQFSKEESERKILLIKDNPQNVGIWIAAISLAMSTAMAEELTFSTNKSNLGMQAELFYYMDKSGKVYYRSEQNQNLTRKPYYMIVGFHPLDRFSKSLRELPNSNFVILDGENLSFGIDEKFSVPESIYFEHASELNMEINLFSDIVLDNYFVYNFTDKIISLYEAYHYLLTDAIPNNSMDYSRTLRYLRILNSFDKSKDKAFDEKIFSRIMQVYPTKFNEDENNGYALIKELAKIADTSDKQKEINDAITKKMIIAIKNMKNGKDSIVTAWKSISYSDLAIDIRSLLLNVFSDKLLKEIAEEISYASEDSINTVLDMYICMIEREIISYKTICQDQVKYAFVISAFDKIKESENKLVLLLKRLSGFVELLACILYSLENGNRKETVFVRAIVKACTDIVSVIICFSKINKADFNTVDNVLRTYVIENEKCDDNILKCYFTAIKNVDTVEADNSMLFKAWLSILKANDLGRFFKNIYYSEFNIKFKDELLEIADNKFKYDEIIVLPKEVIEEISDVATLKDIYSRTEEIFDLYTALKMKKKLDDLMSDMDKFSEAQLVFDETEIKSEFVQTLFKVSVGYENADMHCRILFLFDFEDAVSRNEYIKKYIEQVLKNTSRNQILNQIISLSQVSYLIKKMKSDCSEIEVSWEDNLIECVIPYYKSSMSEQIKKMPCDAIVQKNTLVLLDKVEKKVPKGLGGMLNSILGKFKK